MSSMNSQDLFWGNTPSSGVTSFDVTSFDDASHPQPQTIPQHGAPVVATYSYPGGRVHQVAGGPEAAYPSPMSPSGPGPSRDPHRGRQQSVPRPPAVPPQQINTGLAQEYTHLNPGWSPGSDGTPVSAGRRPSRSGSHVGQQPYNGRPRRSSSQHYDPPGVPPPAQALDDTRMSVDGSQQQQQQQPCLIPNCPYPAYFNVAEQELMEYCGHRHELQAIETGFVKPCAMCKGRPRRTNERICGPICRERERQAHPVQGIYYGVDVTRREPRR